MKTHLCTILLILSALSSHAQTLSWVKTISYNFNHTDDVKQTVDAAGNIYVSRFFSDTIDVDPGPATFYLFPRAFFNMYILKLNSDGNFVWAKQLSGEQVYPSSIITDTVGNIYTTGIYKNVVDFDPGPGISTINSSGYSNTFILKITSQGDFVWVKDFVGSAQFSSVAIDKTGNLAVCGAFQSATDFDPGPGTFILNPFNTSSTDVFITKLNVSGNFLWAKKVGGNSSDYGNTVTFDSSGNVLLAGCFWGTVDFDPGSGVSNLTAVSKDAFILKLQSSGDFVWAKNVGGSAGDEIYAMVLDSAQNIHTTGYFSNTADFNPGAGVFNLISNGNYDAFVLKLTPQGDFIWAKKLGGSNEDRAYSIALDKDGNVYTMGGYIERADMDPGTGIFTLTSPGSAFTSVFISKLDAAGNFVNASAIKKTIDNAYVIAKSIGLDDAKNIYVTGLYYGTVDFDPGPNNYLLTEFYNGVFNVKLSQGHACTWVGAVSHAWENPGNWSCGTVPNATTNVTIGPGVTVIINSNVVINSLSIGAGSTITVSSGNNLTILH